MKTFLLLVFFVSFNSSAGSVGLPDAESFLKKYDTNDSKSIEYLIEISKTRLPELEKSLIPCVDKTLVNVRNIHKTLFTYVSKFHDFPEPRELAVFHFLTTKSKIILGLDDIVFAFDTLETCSLSGK